MQDSHLFISFVTRVGMAKRIFSKSLCKCIPFQAELLQKSLQLNDWLTDWLTVSRLQYIADSLTDWLTDKASVLSPFN